MVAYIEAGMNLMQLEVLPECEHRLTSKNPSGPQYCFICGENVPDVPVEQSKIPSNE